MMELDTADRRLLELLQDGLPICAEPYRELGQALGGLSAREVLDRTARLEQMGLIRRLSGFFNSRALGYESQLCAMTVPEENIDAMAALMQGYPGITHNYLRSHRLNMWFTLCCPGPDASDRVIRELEASGLAGRILRFPCTRRYKIRVAFRMKGETMG